MLMTTLAATVARPVCPPSIISTASRLMASSPMPGPSRGIADRHAGGARRHGCDAVRPGGAAASAHGRLACGTVVWIADTSRICRRPGRHRIAATAGDADHGVRRHLLCLWQGGRAHRPCRHPGGIGCAMTASSENRTSWSSVAAPTSPIRTASGLLAFRRSPAQGALRRREMAPP